MSFEKQNKYLINVCEKLLSDGSVETIIGFQDGNVEGMAIPCFVSKPQEAKNLIWNNRCVPSLSSYLFEWKDKKVAIVAKPCDVRAVVNLIIENQIKREDVHIIGMSCSGMVDEKGNMLKPCVDCKVNTPPVYDVWIEDADVKPKLIKAKKPRSSLDESLIRFKSEIDKCILCYSCRQACYGCYCNTCFMDRGVPDWQSVSPNAEMKMIYHLGRAMHLAGRCVECGACENACASGVDVRYLIRETTDFIEELYGYQTGLDFETEPAMLTYKSDDREIGFLGGDEDV